MKQKTTILLLLLIPTFAFCQSKKLTICFAGSPSFCDIKPPKGFDHTYTNNSSYRAGIDIAFPLRNRSSLVAGAYYSTIGYNVAYKFKFHQSGDPFIPRNSDITANYLEIPLTYSFDIIEKPKLEIYSSLGIVYSMLTSSDTKTTFEDNSVRSADIFMNKSLLSLQAGIGFSYNITNRLGIKIEPHFRFYNKGLDMLMFQQMKATDASIGILFKLWEMK